MFATLQNYYYLGPTARESRARACCLPLGGTCLQVAPKQNRKKTTEKSPRKYTCLFLWFRFPGSRSGMVEVMLKFMTLLAPHLEIASGPFFFCVGVRNRQNKTADVRTLPLLQPRLAYLSGCFWLFKVSLIKSTARVWIGNKENRTPVTRKCGEIRDGNFWLMGKSLATNLACQKGQVKLN